jgi:protein gp37
MGQVTKIEWCHHTYNPWLGCTKVSPACDHCYAEAQEDQRYGRVEWGGTRRRTSEATRPTAGTVKLRQPASVGVSSACHWAISGTTECQLSGGSRL